MVVYGRLVVEALLDDDPVVPSHLLKTVVNGIEREQRLYDFEALFHIAVEDRGHLSAQLVALVAPDSIDRELVGPLRLVEDLHRAFELGADLGD